MCRKPQTKRHGACSSWTGRDEAWVRQSDHQMHFTLSLQVRSSIRQACTVADINVMGLGLGVVSPVLCTGSLIGYISILRYEASRGSLSISNKCLSFFGPIASSKWTHRPFSFAGRVQVGQQPVGAHRPVELGGQDLKIVSCHSSFR